MIMKKLVIVGCGKLANIVADAFLKGLLPEYELIGVYSRSMSSAEALAEKMNKEGRECKAVATISDLLALQPDFLVEAASPAAMRECALSALKQGISIVTLSIGAFSDDGFYAEVMEAAKENKAHVYIVSGATGGFDVLQTVALMGGASARFFNEKGPDALRGTAVYIGFHNSNGRFNKKYWHDSHQILRYCLNLFQFNNLSTQKNKQNC